MSSTALKHFFPHRSSSHHARMSHSSPPKSERQEYINKLQNKFNSMEACRSHIRQKGYPMMLNDAVKHNTMVGDGRLKDVVNLWSDVLARGVAGDWVETGTYKGGTSMLAAMLVRAAADHPSCPRIHRTIWLADSFEGLPAKRAEDAGKDKGGLQMDPAGSYSGYGGVAYVRSQFSRQSFRIRGAATISANTRANPVIRFLPGWFNATIPSAPIDKIALLRLDGDMCERCPPPPRLAACPQHLAAAHVTRC